MSGNETSSYCREIESYLCRKNDGHLIRVVGPSFELVSRWAADGVPLKIAFRGIDRYFERYYRKGPRRRPVKIDFCEADVLDAFDEWKRAVLVVSPQSRVGNGESGCETAVESREQSRVPRGPSLPEHVERVLLKLTSARVAGSIGGDFDALLDGVSRELDVARASAGRLRGDLRQALIARLDALDEQLLALARQSVDPTVETALSREADDELSGYRATMTPDAYARARHAAMNRLLRERFNLPVIRFQP